MKLKKQNLLGGFNRYRLVIAEYEEYIVDDQRPYDKVPTMKDRRLVFVVVPLRALPRSGF